MTQARRPSMFAKAGRLTRYVHDEEKRTPTTKFPGTRASSDWLSTKAAHHARRIHCGVIVFQPRPAYRSLLPLRVTRYQERRKAMSGPSKVSAGARRQKAFRDRMTRMGMSVPRIYMTADEQALVKDVLASHRHGRTERLIEGMAFDSRHASWSAPDLYEALREYAATQPHLAAIELHDAPPAVELVMTHYGDLSVQLAVSAHEIFVATALCEMDSVTNTVVFNEACLRMGPRLPLSNIGLVGAHYVLFGQISAHAPLANIVEELDVLGRNAIDAMNELSGLIQ